MFKYQIGDLLTLTASKAPPAALDKPRLAVVGRILQEYGGGCRKLYIARPSDHDGDRRLEFHKDLVTFDEVELEPWSGRHDEAEMNLIEDLARKRDEMDYAIRQIQAFLGEVPTPVLVKADAEDVPSGTPVWLNRLRAVLRAFREQSATKHPAVSLTEVDSQP